MILLSLLFQIFSLFFGIFVAKGVFTPSTTPTIEGSFVVSKLLLVLSLLSIGIILLGAFSFHHDRFFLQLPLLYQKYAMVITWETILIYLAFLTGFTLYMTYRLRGEKFRLYFVTLMILNGLLLLNHYQKNQYGGDLVKEGFQKKEFIKQSTNFSCTSASVATIAKYLDINVSEKRVAQLSRLTTLGANSGQVRFALNRLNIKYHTLTQEFQDPNQIKAPAILYVDNPVVGREGHAIVYLGKHHYGYEIWDPVGLNIYLSEKELREIWHGRGIECQREE